MFQLQTSNEKLSTEVSHFKTECSTFQKKVEAGNTLKQQLQSRIAENVSLYIIIHMLTESIYYGIFFFFNL